MEEFGGSEQRRCQWEIAQELSNGSFGIDAIVEVIINSFVRREFDKPFSFQLILRFGDHLPNKPPLWYALKVKIKMQAVDEPHEISLRN